MFEVGGHGAKGSGIEARSAGKIFRLHISVIRICSSGTSVLCPDVRGSMLFCSSLAIFFPEQIGLSYAKEQLS